MLGATMNTERIHMPRLCLFAFALVVLAAAAPAFTEPAYPESPEGVTLIADVAYLAQGREEKLDIYLPVGRKAGQHSPAMVMIHGGGWARGDKTGAREYETGAILARAGYVAVSINYQMAPGRRWPTNLLDCKNAVRFLRVNAEYYSVDRRASV